MDDGRSLRAAAPAHASCPPGPAPAGRPAAASRSEDEVALLAEVVEAQAVLSGREVIDFAFRRLAQLLGAMRCSLFSEDEAGAIVERVVVTPDGAGAPGRRPCEPAVAMLPLVAQVLRDGALRRVLRPVLPGALVAARSEPVEREVLAVPVGDRSVLVIEQPPGEHAEEGDVRFAGLVAAVVSEPARDARRVREQQQYETIASAMRHLLEAGVRAGSAIEAAEALARTAAKVLDFPVAAAYLVDDAGRISRVVTVGARPGRGEQLQSRLTGQLAADSPVWRRTVEGPEPGPDLVDDTAADGLVRPGGVAQVLGLRSLAAIPLLSSDGPLGLVLCGDSTPRRRWRPGIRELLAQLALEGAVVVDNARLREAERHEARHDALTGLLNRRAFSQSLRDALAASRRSGEHVAVLLLDLDRFKEVNDHLGHHRGDALLVDVASRLRRSTRSSDLLARLGGDEFALLLTGRAHEDEAEAVAAKIASLLEDAFEVGDHVLHVDASIGIACFPDHAADADGLLQRADLAMYAAKRSGRGHEVFDPRDADRAADSVGLLGELRRALHEPDELFLHYQPKVDLRTGAVSGVEALVRWDHPRLGLVGPDRFVPVAEETDLVRSLTAWVVPEALRQVREWLSQGLELRVAVNVSARDVSDQELPAKVERWLEEAGLPGTTLVLEVTERTVMSEGAARSGTLQRLRASGVEVSLDDFGTGYSSLAYLESLPVDEIKIDRQFLSLRRSRRSVIRSIIALGHDLDMRVVAEGVETAEHADWLARMGCDEAQGYYFSRPVPPGELAEWARRAESGAGPRSTGPGKRRAALSW
ncbi:MAG: EAL domain-containing protein [Actinomycetota bacterium]|nr:EAL domain-containing protein [Actinomycetota bacterium]